MAARTVIAFDFGTRRIGIAIGQELTKTATPLTTLRLADNVSLTDLATTLNWEPIDELIRDWQPQAAVVGLPLAADGTESAITKGAKAFGEQVQKRYNLETYWIDERLTSVEAERMIASGSLAEKSGKDRSRKARGGRNLRSKSKLADKDAVDRMAAKIILESWFNEN